jgi:hypothetical protein
MVEWLTLDNLLAYPNKALFVGISPHGDIGLHNLLYYLCTYNQTIKILNPLLR